MLYKSPVTAGQKVHAKSCRHVAENSNPMSGETCDGSGLSDPFYTWGALNAFASLVEADDRPFKLFPEKGTAG